MNLDTPSSGNGASTLNSNGKRTLSTLVSQLQRDLRGAFEGAVVSGGGGATRKKKEEYDAPLLHPLNTDSSLQSIKSPHGILTSALQSFETQVLNAESSSSNEKIRLLALLRENSQLQLSHTALEEGRDLSARLLKRRRLYKDGGYPVHAAGRRITDVLEAVAKECGLEVYPGAEEDDTAGGGDAMEVDLHSNTDGKSRSQTITMAGKGIVIDVDIEHPPPLLPPRTSTNVSPSAVGRVAAVRFSYGMEGSTDTGIDKLLSRQAKESQWEGFRQSLMELVKLDQLVPVPSEDENGENGQTMAEARAVDPFSALASLSSKVEEVFKAELEVASSAQHLLTQGHGFAILHHTTPYLTTLYNLPAMAFLNEEWKHATASGFQSESMSAVARLHGAQTLRFEVELDERMAQGEAVPVFPLLSGKIPEGISSTLGDGTRLVARLDEPLVISQAAGKRLQDILLGPTSSIAPTPSLQPPDENEQHPPYEFLLLPNITEKQWYRLVVPDMPDIHVTLQAHTSSSGGSGSNSNGGFQITKLGFKSADQLFAAVEVMRLQCLFNELLSSAFGEVEEVQDDDGNVRLEDLFSDEPPANISLSIRPDVSIFPPTLHLTFILPHLPSWLPVTAAFSITPSLNRPSGYELSYTLDCPEPALDEQLGHLLGDDRGLEKMAKTLGTSRSVGMLLRFVGRRLLNAKGIWEGVVDKPSFGVELE